MTWLRAHAGSIQPRMGVLEPHKMYCDCFRFRMRIATVSVDLKIITLQNLNSELAAEYYEEEQSPRLTTTIIELVERYI